MKKSQLIGTSELFRNRIIEEKGLEPNRSNTKMKKAITAFKQGIYTVIYTKIHIDDDAL
jgi:hypothetical protein